MQNLPFLDIPQGTRLYLSPFSIESYYVEFGMLSDTLLEGWGFRRDERSGGCLLEAGCFHLGKLHGIGVRSDLIEEVLQVGLFLEGRFVEPKDAFGRDLSKEGECQRAADSAFPYPIYAKNHRGRLSFRLDPKKGFEVSQKDGNWEMRYLGLEGLDATKPEIDFLCCEDGKFTLNTLDLEPVPETETGMGLHLNQNTPGAIAYDEGYYQGETDSKGKPHGFGRYEQGHQLSNGHNHQYEVYEGEWKHGAFHGRGTYTYLDLRSNNRYRHRYTGTWKNGRKEGHGLQYNQCLERVGSYFADAFEAYRGNYHNGEPHGTGLLLSFSPTEGKTLLCSDDFQEGRPVGMVEIHYPNGNLFFGNYNGFFTEGEGVYCLVKQGASFKAEFSANGPKIETIEFTYKENDVPMLFVHHRVFGWQSDKSFLALIPGTPGVHTMEDIAVFRNDAGLSDFRFTVLKTKGNKVTYAVDGDYDEGKAASTATIEIGQTQNHGRRVYRTGRVDGEEIGCEEGCELTVRCF